VRRQEMCFKKKERGFTLVEILIVMVIFLILAVALVSSFDPIATIAKAYDTRRKKDLGRIKIAFEEYFSDKGCYPTQDRVDELMDSDNCFGDVFSPWLPRWSCNREGKTYDVVVGGNDVNCPSWFKLLTNLENRLDEDIPEGWYNLVGFTFGDGSYGIEDANYGVSSTNVLWNDPVQF